MNKNILYRLYAAAFVGVCLVPSALMPFVKNGSNNEKRDLAAKPSVKKEDGSLNLDFFSDFDSYFSEHFAFRSKLVDIDGHLKASLLGTSNNPSVIVGREGWLYYGETADDFMDIHTMSLRAADNIRRNLTLMDEYCKAHGAQFLFTAAPNKNSVYPEYMPYNYVEGSGDDNFSRVYSALGESSFSLDMKAALKSNKEEIPLPLYHKTDTHWNNLGAYIGHSVIADRLGVERCPTGETWYKRYDRLGDLAVMIYPETKANDMNVYNGYEFGYGYEGRFRGLDDLTIKTTNPAREGKLLMYRDSYGEAILPYLAECFGEAEFSRVVPYRMDSIDGGAVVLEIVERNLPNLQKYAPVMSAPVAEDVPEPELLYTKDIDIMTEQSGKYLHIFGELPEEFFSEKASEIYVSVGGRTYIAFSCFEDKLLGREGEVSDRGFSLYVPSENAAETDDITVISLRSDGAVIKSN